MEKQVIIISIIELVLNFIGLILIVFGWLIPYKQKIKIETNKQVSEEKFQKLKWEKELIDKQISSFYGPISALLNEENLVRTKVFKQIGRPYIFCKKYPTLDSLPERDRKFWMHFVDTYKIPLNNKILDIIRDNKHLIYKSNVPECFEDFLEYAIIWELYDNQYRHNVPNSYNYRYDYNFPENFIKYIDHTLEALLRKQAELTLDLGEKDNSDNKFNPNLRGNFMFGSCSTPDEYDV